MNYALGSAACEASRSKNCKLFKPYALCRLDAADKVAGQDENHETDEQGAHIDEHDEQPVYLQGHALDIIGLLVELHDACG